MAELTGKSVEEIQADRLEYRSGLLQKPGDILLYLKGAFTVIAEPDGRATVIPVAYFGTCQGRNGRCARRDYCGSFGAGRGALFRQPVAGAWIHAQAGLFALDRVGNPASVMASDVVDSISDVLIGLV